MLGRAFPKLLAEQYQSEIAVGEKADTLFEICLIYFAPRSNE
jgi:hypothetical protein